VLDYSGALLQAWYTKIFGPSFTSRTISTSPRDPARTKLAAHDELRHKTEHRIKLADTSLPTACHHDSSFTLRVRIDTYLHRDESTRSSLVAKRR
jgi:hypothetical protein